MFKSTLTAVALVATFGAAFAEGPVNYPDSDERPSPPAASTVSRAEVIAEVFAARARGEEALVAEDSGSSYFAMREAQATSLARLAARSQMALLKP